MCDYLREVGKFPKINHYSSGREALVKGKD